jgi:protein-disulfide isomerase
MKTPSANLVGWILFGIASAIVLGFIGLVSYYVYHLRYGDAQTIVERFEPQFTAVDGTTRSRQLSVSAIPAATLVREHNPRFGAADAPITLMMFIDFECPFCAASVPVMQDVMDTYGPAVQFVFKHLPLTQIHPNALDAAHASMCAHEQGVFWEYYQALFDQGVLNQDAYRAHATTLDLDMNAFDTCIAERRYESAILADMQDAVAIEAAGTPTYLLDSTKIEGGLDRAIWDDLLLEAISRQSTTQ